MTKKKVVSPKYTLTKEDGKKILIGLVVALSGAAATYLLEVLGQMDFGEWTPVVVALLSVVSNMVRKYVTETKE